ncbi:hypothetical protein LguiA_030715 [Lonicera macranthoides]
MSSMSILHSIYANPVLILLILLLNLAISAATNGGNETDRHALLALKSNLQDPLGALNSWNDSVHFCGWQGITCSGQNRRVTALNLGSSGLAGPLSPYIGNLSFIREIRLSNNSLQGEIPPQIGLLFGLQALWLQNNSFEGKIPTNLSQCSSLLVLSLGNNKLEGAIPTELGALSKLLALSLTSNNLRGEIPSSIGNLTSIQMLYANDNVLEGSIPQMFGQLQNLTDLGFAFNNLFGTIPSSIYNISSLTDLSLASNELGSGLPQNIGLSLPHLKVIQLWGNKLTGTIPISLSNASDLEHIEFNENNFVGKVPMNLGSLTRLRILNLDYNFLGQGKPDDADFISSVTNCSMLEKFAVVDNRLGGILPNSVSNLSIQLRYFGVAINQMYGEIPWGFGNLANLERIELGYNQFEGQIPDDIGKIPRLKYGLGSERSPIDPMFDNGLSLHNYALKALPDRVMEIVKLKLLSNLGEEVLLTTSNNMRNGEESRKGNKMKECLVSMIKIGVSCSMESPQDRMDLTDVIRELYYVRRILEELEVELEKLQRLSLENNAFGSGEADDMAFVYSLTNCTVLEILSLLSNRFAGILPNIIGNLSPKLREFGVLYNQISGVIPSGFGNLTKLERLGLAYNQFEGKIPNDIVRLQELRTLHFAGNRLSGQIPFSMGNMTFLSRVFLQENALEGTIPSSLGNCQNLLWLNFSQNNISGTIPKELFSASPLSMSLNLAHNKLVGLIPAEVGKLNKLVDLDLSENGLSGKIPVELGSCSSLLNLYLKNNFLQGSIPPSFISLRGVQNIDLSSNNLSGEVPIFFRNFALVNLNLSFNNFEGKLPAEGIFTNTSVVSVLGNNGLCGGISEMQLPKCSAETSPQRRFSNLQIILITIGCLVLFLSVTSYFVVCLLKRKRRVPSSGILLEESFLKVSYGDLSKATDGFSSTNLIGVGGFGSVYKGILDREQMVVAIKVLNLEQQGASKSFLAECEALRNIRHRNLVKLITSCSSIDFQGNEFKALVYEFMPNGSLERWLHSIEETQTLALHQRIAIAIDVASALDYLHHHCENPILHCDLKPNNVLLDKDMVAHLGDFGLARILHLEPNSANQSKTIGIRGTVGYVAPEYGLGSKVSMNGDVYSYGILLLEMITGKSPVDPMFNEGLNLHNYARKALPDHVMEIVDPKRLSNEEDDGALEEVDKEKSSKQSRIGNRLEDCLIALVKIGVACSMESPQERMEIDDAIHDLHLARDILEGA